VLSHAGGRVTSGASGRGALRQVVAVDT